MQSRAAVTENLDQTGPQPQSFPATFAEA